MYRDCTDFAESLGSELSLLLILKSLVLELLRALSKGLRRHIGSLRLFVPDWALLDLMVSAASAAGTIVIKQLEIASNCLGGRASDDCC